MTYYSLVSRSKTDDPTEAASSQPATSTEANTVYAKSYDELASLDFESRSATSSNTYASLDDDNYTQCYNTCSLPPKSMADLLSKTNDFKAINFSRAVETPQLAYWYGISQFVTICPTRDSYSIEHESKANLILSSVSIAINNSGWFVCTIFFLLTFLPSWLMQFEYFFKFIDCILFLRPI